MVLTLAVRNTDEDPVEVSKVLPHPVTVTFVPTVIEMLELTRQTGDTFSIDEKKAMVNYFVL